MNEKAKKQIEALNKHAKLYTGRHPTVRTRSSLQQITKTKEQAERFMKMLESA